SYRGDCLLKLFDNDLGMFLSTEMSKKGVRVLLRSRILAIERVREGLICQLSDGTTIETDAVMTATGRNPNTEGLGLERAGVEVAANGAVIVDDDFQTSVPSIHAIGDVVHRMQLTPV